MPVVIIRLLGELAAKVGVMVLLELMSARRNSVNNKVQTWLTFARRALSKKAERREDYE